MTKEAALHRFFSQFGIPAYEETTVPDDVTYPYLTYQSTVGLYDGYPISITARLFYYTDSNVLANAKAQEIADAIGARGTRIACDGGFIWITHGSPWCLKTTDESDKTVKARIMNVNLAFYTF